MTTVAPTAAGDSAARRQRTLGIGALLLTTVLWGTGPSLTKSIGAPGVVVAFWRLWTGAVFLQIVYRLRGGRFGWTELRRTAVGGSLFGLSLAFQFTALRLTAVANVAVIGAMTPVIVLPISAFVLHERVTRRQVVCAALAIAGVVIVVTAHRSGADDRRGDALALASTGVWAAYLFATKRARRTVDTLTWMAGMNLSGALVVTPVAILLAHDHFTIRAGGWWHIVGVVLLPGSSGHGLMIWAQRHVELGLSTVLLLCEPVFTTGIAAIFLRESIVTGQVIGMSLVLAAVGLLVYTSARPGGAAPAADAAPGDSPEPET